jgi:hypothetical protein
MVDWESPEWGGGITHAANGSWSPEGTSDDKNAEQRS